MGKQMIDQYIYLHFSSGIMMYFFGLSIRNTLIIHTIFEILENTKVGMLFINKYLTFWPGSKNYPDSLVNSLGDTVGVLAGWISAYLIDQIGNKYGLYDKHIT